MPSANARNKTCPNRPTPELWHRCGPAAVRGQATMPLHVRAQRGSPSNPLDHPLSEQSPRVLSLVGRLGATRSNCEVLDSRRSTSDRGKRRAQRSRLDTKSGGSWSNVFTATPTLSLLRGHGPRERVSRSPYTHGSVHDKVSKQDGFVSGRRMRSRAPVALLLTVLALASAQGCSDSTSHEEASRTAVVTALDHLAAELAADPRADAAGYTERLRSYLQDHPSFLRQCGRTAGPIRRGHYEPLRVSDS